MFNYQMLVVLEQGGDYQVQVMMPGRVLKPLSELTKTDTPLLKENPTRTDVSDTRLLVWHRDIRTGQLIYPAPGHGLTADELTWMHNAITKQWREAVDLVNAPTYVIPTPMDLRDVIAKTSVTLEGLMSGIVTHLTNPANFRMLEGHISVDVYSHGQDPVDAAVIKQAQAHMISRGWSLEHSADYDGENLFTFHALV